MDPGLPQATDIHMLSFKVHGETKINKSENMLVPKKQQLCFSVTKDHSSKCEQLCLKQHISSKNVGLQEIQFSSHEHSNNDADLSYGFVPTQKNKLSLTT